MCLVSVLPALQGLCSEACIRTPPNPLVCFEQLSIAWWYLLLVANKIMLRINQPINQPNKNLIIWNKVIEEVFFWTEITWMTWNVMFCLLQWSYVWIQRLLILMLEEHRGWPDNNCPLKPKWSQDFDSQHILYFECYVISLPNLNKAEKSHNK